MSELLYKIDNLKYNLDSFILELKDFYIKSNQKIAILGENGSGKTTLLNILSGFYKTNKKVKVLEKFIEDIPPKIRSRKIAYLPQFSEVLFNFTVFETVLMGRFPNIDGYHFTENDIKKTETIIKKFELENYKNRQFTNLSGGEKKRVMLARIFNQESDILLLDEPFAMLDVKHSIHLIKILKETTKTVICIIHDINLGINLFDRFIFLKKGKIIYDINREELNENILSNVFEVYFKCVDNYFFFDL